MGCEVLVCWFDRGRPGAYRTLKAPAALSWTTATTTNSVKAPAVHGATRRELARASLSPSARPVATRCAPRCVSAADGPRCLRRLTGPSAAAPFIPSRSHPRPPQPTRSLRSLVPRAALSRTERASSFEPFARCAREDHEGATARATVTARPGATLVSRRRGRAGPRVVAPGRPAQCCPGGMKGRGSVAPLGSRSGGPTRA